jgi:hypothetical protein
MSKLKVGDVVIVPTNQAGTVHSIEDGEVCVLLRNADFWYGADGSARIPKNKEELKHCVLNVDKWAKKR